MCRSFVSGETLGLFCMLLIKIPCSPSGLSEYSASLQSIAVLGFLSPYLSADAKVSLRTNVTDRTKT